jgi:cell division protein FtsI/penicillin-binding protein 2
MSDAFAVSCNTYFAQLVLRLAQQIGSDSLRTLYEGIGVSFVGHSRASIQQPSRGVSIAAGVLSEHLRLPQFVMPALSDEWRLGQVAIGQGSWTMSPVAILPILGAIANNGLLVPITFEIAENRVAAQRIMPVAVAQTVAAMMQRVTSDGTGKLVANGAVAQRHGWRLIGKTGTAQRAVCAAEQQPAYRRYDHCAVVLTEDGLFGGIASSVDSSIAPLAIVAYVRDGGSGGGTAARLADAIASIAIDNRSAVRRVR